ncbi:Eco57I restriction-modification methylase domain-containing protein [Kitasatospora sp. NPDC089913]|uniref:Eco57I restriction-modification methylase domain-containing protein n=1 Tax=Kitasatospora sp. NPDC089913 TaxID=3364080 RepID=UPI00382F2F13
MSPRPAASRGLAAAKAKALDGRAQHQEWLELTEVSGPFLTMPVLLGTWPQLDAVEREQRNRLRARHADWQTDMVAGRDEWAAYVLRDLLEWGDALELRQGEDDDLALDLFTVDVPEHGARLRADFALVEPGGGALGAEPDAAAAAKRVPLIGMVVPTGTVPTARAAWGGEWSATPADRLARLCRHHGIPLGLVTDGRWWCLVWAPVGGVTTTALFDTVGWNEAAERNVVRAWISLLRRRRFFEYEAAETLEGLLKKSLEAGEEVTDALGVQVRQAVELLVDAIGRADARAMERGAVGLHAEDVSAQEVYRAAVAVMMRVVFLLFAEERGLLPASSQVYAESYSAGRLCADLEARALAEGEGALEHTTAAWHRLIALFHAVYGGVKHPELELPAYDGSIFDPTKYPWLEQGSPLLAIDDRTVLHMLQSVQYVQIGRGKTKERRRLTFRALDVEQIGYVYEGLLSYDGKRAVDTVIGLIGPVGLEHEVPLRELESMAASCRDVKALAKKISEAYKEPKPGIGAAGKLEKLLAPLAGEAVDEAKRLLYAACRDRALVERLLPFFGIIRRDLRDLPVVMPAGALYVTQSSLRKNTGTHYTPRRLAEEVVTHALEPLVYRVGPLQTAKTEDWVHKTAEEILDLKVADIAMGSGAFLVAACRYLADRLIDAWVREKRQDAIDFRSGRVVDTVTAVDAESDPIVVKARREIIEHCLYGVDINPAAVEMAKLSLWLVSMDPTQPFTFLDDRLVAGDSLLGITSLDQLKAVHLDVSKGDLIGSAADIERQIEDAVRARRAITEIRGENLQALAEKRKLLEEVRQHTARLQLIGDLIAGAALATCASGRVEWYAANGGERIRDLFPLASSAAKVLGLSDVREEMPEASARRQAKGWLASELPEGSLERRPVHWPLEFPEVFQAQGGFDAIVGNPPFLGGQKLTGAMGEAYREYMVDYLAAGKRGSADMVAYFELRAHELLNSAGQAGLIATNTLAQGDTREVGLDQLEAAGVEIRRAIKSAPWPSSSAVLEYCAVWTSKVTIADQAERMLDRVVVPRGISTSLNPKTREASWAESLASNKGISFQGSIVLGLGFTLPSDRAKMWISEDERYWNVLFPYLNGQDVNNSPVHESDRWVINFHDWPEDRAAQYGKAHAQVLRDVKPERDKNSRPARRQRWWQFAERAAGLYAATAPLEQCIVMAQVSKVVMPALVPTRQVLDQKLVVFASEDPALLGILSGAPHYWWALDRSATMKADLSYSPTDVFMALVLPTFTDDLRAAGAHLNSFRRELMLHRNIGLTATYNLFHDSSCQDDDIVELRAIHEEIDRATIAAYGWYDLLDPTGATRPADPTHETFPLDHGFHETDQGTRYTIGLLARTEIIDRLRRLNHQAYADEVFLGLHKKPNLRPDLPSPSAEARRRKAERPRVSGAPGFGDDGLFPPEGALF